MGKKGKAETFWVLSIQFEHAITFLNNTNYINLTHQLYERLFPTTTQVDGYFIFPLKD